MLDDGVPSRRTSDLVKHLMEVLSDAPGARVEGGPGPCTVCRPPALKSRSRSPSVRSVCGGTARSSPPLNGAFLIVASLQEDASGPVA
jgi:hypothetical protein